MKEINGHKIGRREIRKLKIALIKLKKQPKLKIILIGNDSSSEIFVSKKRKMAKDLGINFELKRFNTLVSEKEVISQINHWQNSGEIVGIMIQLPIPSHLDRQKVLGSINRENDVDGLRYCAELEADLVPPVISAIDLSLAETHENISEKKIAIIGKGFLVGLPIMRYLKNKYPNSNVSMIDRQSLKESDLLKKYDILIGAASSANIVTPDMIKEGVILVDAGSFKKGRRIFGNFSEDCYQKSSFYTPVPGGIGPLTVTLLFKNLYKLYASRK